MVYLNSVKVGALDRSGSGAISFAYDRDWLNHPNAMPVSVSLPLTDETFRGFSVINVFENLLPDAERVRKNVAERLGADGVDPFSLLAATGRDCVGALQFMRDGEAPGVAGEVRGNRVTDAEIAQIIRNLKVNPLGIDPDEDDFRISLAGAQDKTALLKLNGHWHRPIGTTATTHIVKPAIGVLHNDINLSDSVQNEFVCLKLCSALGLNVCEAEIVSFEDQLALSVERFDRRWTKDERLLRLPQEDFCQALSVPSTRKYQKDDGPGILAILDRLKESDHAHADRRAFFKAQMIYWLIGATDGHAKNFSIAHKPGGGFCLTPFYDVLSAQPIVDAGRLRRNRYKMAMSVGDNNHTRLDEIQLRHFKQTAQAANLPRKLVDDVKSELLGSIPNAVAVIEALVDNIVSETLVKSIKEGLLGRQEALTFS